MGGIIVHSQRGFISGILGLNRMLLFIVDKRPPCANASLPLFTGCCRGRERYSNQVRAELIKLLLIKLRDDTEANAKYRIMWKNLGLTEVGK